MSFRILEPEEFDALGPADQQRYLDLLQAELETQGVGWQPTPKQLMADTAADRATETLFGGAAGGGKSDWLLWRADRLSRAIPRHATLFLRGSFPELRRSVIRRSQVRFNYGDDRPVWRAADKEWRYPNGSVIEFGYCETDADVGQYLSAEYDAIFFDELTEFTTYAYEMIRSRARTTRVKALDGARPHICGATNPGRRGHTWVKNLFVLPTDYGDIPDVWATRGLDDDLRFTLLPSDADDERHIAFVPATVLDNPHIDPGYVRHLMSLPENLRRQYLYGDWDVFEGQFFAEFTKTKVDGDGLIVPWHVVEPFDIPSSWPRIRCIDYGFAAPFACLWIAFDENGYGHVYRELYGTKMLPSEQARQILDLSTFTDTDGRVKPEKIDYTVADPACWSNTGQSAEGLSIAQQWAKHGLQARKANNDRLAGWARVREYLAEDEHGNPGLRIFRTCDNLVRTFPEQIYDKNKPEDLDTTLEDHALDALRYGLQTRPRRYRPKAPPLDRMQQLLKRDRERSTRRRGRFPGLS